MRIHIVTNSSTLQYHDYCVNNHRTLASKPEELEFVSYCLDEGSFRTLSAKGNAVRLRDGSGSVGHAIGIEAILKNLKPDDINVISDSDCIVLCKGWDDHTKLALESNGIVGTTYEDIGGFSSGDGHVQTFKKIPNFTWAALSPKHDWQFGAMSDKPNPLLIDTQELSETFNLPIGFSLLREPIWQLPVYLRTNGIKYCSLKFVRPTSDDAKACRSGEDYHTEYQLPDGTPLVAHQRGSMSKQFRVHHLSKTFYDACEAYIARSQ